MMSKWFQSCGCLAVTVMLSAIAAACDNSGLSESEARRVIDEEVLPKSRKWLQVEIDLYSTPLWRNGEAAGLTVRENCWISDRQPLHAKEWWYVTQEDGEISPECPDIASAELFVSEQDRKWYAKKINLVKDRLKVEEITEILTRDGVATVTYTTTYEQTDLFKKWKESLRYVVGENTPRPEPGKACLQKYDQGWRACER